MKFTQLECRSSFQAFPGLGQEEDEEEVQGINVCPPILIEGHTSIPCPETVLVVGDSQVKYLDTNFCATDRRRRTRVFPRVGIKKNVTN